MKTFRGFNINDKAFCCRRYGISYTTKSVIEISIDSMTIKTYRAGSAGYVKIIREELDKYRFVSYYESSSRKHHSDVIVFARESEAIRYCKANLLHELRDRIKLAKTAIQDVVQFRLDNIDHLNKDWIESEILKLEKMEREIL